MKTSDEIISIAERLGHKNNKQSGLYVTTLEEGNVIVPYLEYCKSVFIDLHADELSDNGLKATYNKSYGGFVIENIKNLP